MKEPSSARSAYAASGVDVDAGEALVQRIKPAVAKTARAGAEPALGGFGAVFDMAAAGHEGSLLVASTDGVGTKLRLASELNRHRGIGIDLVAMCVNDVLAQGAEPLFFLDYYATGKLEVDAAAEVISGVAEGCRVAGCALIGGETAEMPGHYAPGDYDLAGFVVGAVKRENLLPRPTVGAGDVLVALPSAGAHSNGYSLIRRLIREKGWDLSAPLPGTNASLGDALMEPTRIYAAPVKALLRDYDGTLKGVAHITGGGITGNVPRMLPDGTAAAIERAALPTHPLMAFLAAEGGLSAEEMEATFNCGVGLVLAVDAKSADVVVETLRREGEAPAVIGTVVAGDGPAGCTIA